MQHIPHLIHEKNFMIKLMWGKDRLGTLAAKLDALSPLKVMARGYAIPMDDEGNVIRYAKDMEPGMEFNLKLSDGEKECIVKEG